jgi:hypothetical protein
MKIADLDFMIFIVIDLKIISVFSSLRDSYELDSSLTNSQ